jgi:hypothetical protein
LRKAATSKGLNHQLPVDHPLIAMLKRTLVYSHEVDSAAATNYVANVSRTLAYVQRRLVENKTPPEHWSALVTVDVDLYIEYFRL